MASGYSPRWRRLLHKCTPFLFKKCPAGNYHFRFDRLCFCRCGEHTGRFHGGIYDMKLKQEYQYCKACEESQHVDTKGYYRACGKPSYDHICKHCGYESLNI